MSNHAIREQAAALGFTLKRIQPGPQGGRPATRWSCTCSKCGHEGTFAWAVNTSPAYMVQNIEQAGWFHSRRQRICPNCIEEAKEARKMNKIEPVSNPKLQRKVFALLDDHFDEDRKLYKAGWSDKKVAEAADTSEQFVINVRRGAYGELAEDPAVTAIRAEIDELRREAHSMSDELLDRMGKIEDKITQLHTRLDGYAMKKVV